MQSSIRHQLFNPSKTLITLFLILVTLAFISLFVGVGDLTDANWGTTFLRLRSMRILAACLVGGGLAVAGVTMQGLFRNPLADPGVIGTSAGAVLGGMVAVLISFLIDNNHWFPPLVLLPLGCVTGGLISLWIVLLVSKHSSDNLAVLLAGVVLGMFFASLGAALNA